MIQTTLKSKAIAPRASLISNNAGNAGKYKATEKDILKQKLKVKLYMSYGLFAASDIVMVTVFILYKLSASNEVKSPFALLYLAIASSWIPCHIYFSFKL
jgi:hypothetical protein